MHCLKPVNSFLLSGVIRAVQATFLRFLALCLQHTRRSSVTYSLGMAGSARSLIAQRRAKAQTQVMYRVVPSLCFMCAFSRMHHRVRDVQHLHVHRWSPGRHPASRLKSSYCLCRRGRRDHRAPAKIPRTSAAPATAATGVAADRGGPLAVAIAAADAVGAGGGVVAGH